MEIGALVVGFGSIGRKHARLLKEVGARVSVVTRSCREVERDSAYTYFESIGDVNMKEIRYIVIAVETSRHIECMLNALRLNKRARIMVEKPLAAESKQLVDLGLTIEDKERVFIGFNLRYLPVVKKSKELCKQQDKKFTRAEFFSHSYLPHWRDIDYRKSSSARWSTGGGVLRDLSHELDLMQWLCGTPHKLNIYGGHLSNLECEVEDTIYIVGSCKQAGLVSIGLSYTQHFETRGFSLISNNETLVTDLMSGKIIKSSSNGTELIECPCEDFDDTYRKMHRDIIQEGGGECARYIDGQLNIKCIEDLDRELGMHEK
ncbi:conserved hypothetical protein [Synechococcus sp. CC9311]|nr:conserved hypothetical protein [Synechococcus sp. CC9311]